MWWGWWSDSALSTMARWQTGGAGQADRYPSSCPKEGRQTVAPPPPNWSLH